MKWKEVQVVERTLHPNMQIKNRKTPEGMRSSGVQVFESRNQKKEMKK